MKWTFFLIALFPAIALADDPPPAKTPQPDKDYQEVIKDTAVKIDMVRIPGGTIKTSPGSMKEPATEVVIKPFWIAKTETTWEQYDTYHLQLDLPKDQRKFVKWPAAKTRPSPPYDAPDRGWGHNGWPVIHTSHFAAKSYCEWLSQKTNKKYRLPTVAEWEYACRAGAAEAKASDDTAWTEENSEEQTHQVAKKKANAWGLYDMLGNAGEWCTSIDGKTGYLCGGYYAKEAKKVTCLLREPFTPDWQLKDPNDPKGMWWLSDGTMCGFRVVCEE
jgi:formylglycine-generating enzyme required for sulfatase activity